MLFIPENEKYPYPKCSCGKDATHSLEIHYRRGIIKIIKRIKGELFDGSNTNKEWYCDNCFNERQIGV